MADIINSVDRSPDMYIYDLYIYRYISLSICLSFSIYFGWPTSLPVWSVQTTTMRCGRLPSRSDVNIPKSWVMKIRIFHVWLPEGKWFFHFSQVEVLDAAAQITGCPADAAKDGENPAENLQKFVFLVCKIMENRKIHERSMKICRIHHFLLLNHRWKLAMKDLSTFDGVAWCIFWLISYRRLIPTSKRNHQ